jgi:hypothetical protein
MIKINFDTLNDANLVINKFKDAKVMYKGKYTI